MNHLLRFFVIGVILSLIACGSRLDAEQVPSAVPTGSSFPIENETTGEVSASGIVVPVLISELGFILSGPVKEIYVKEGASIRSGELIIALNAPTLEYAVPAAEADLSSAQSYANLQRFRRTIVNQAGKTLYLTGPHEVLEVADSRLAQAQASLEKAQAEFSQTLLVAPFDGTVVALNAVVGQFVQSSQPVAILADLTSLQIETTDLSERDISSIRDGQTAKLHIDALDMDVAGEVKQISPLAEMVDGDVVYKTILKLDAQPDGLLWGMSVDVLFE